MAKRLLRLLPALFIAVLLSAYVLGPALTTLPTSSYLGGGGALSYVAQNTTLSHPALTLPGVFGGEPVNYSLWTLPVEARAYLLVAALGLLGLLRRPRAVMAGAVILTALASPELYASRAAQPLATMLTTPYAFRVLAVFLAGAALYIARDRTRPHARLTWLAAAGLTASAWMPADLRLATWTLTVPYLATSIGALPVRRLAFVARPGDVSYGIYLYGYVVQRALVAEAPGMSPLVLLVTSAPLTYLLALASWRLIEQPALRLKARLAPQPALPTSAVLEAA